MGRKRTRTVPQDVSDAARASSARSRINIPFNLNNWKDVEKEHHEDLRWYHQYILNEGLSRKEVEATVNYEYSSIYRFLKGISDGSYDNFTEAIRKYRRLVDMRSSIKKVEFIHTPITELIFSTMDYTFANNCMTLIVGESCIGKTTTMQAWGRENNHGTSVYTDCLPGGGPKAFLASIAKQVGVGQALSFWPMLDAVCRSFDPDRCLICDNMHRAKPSPRSDPKHFDIVQYLYDRTGCAVIMSATYRLTTVMRHSDYMFEQIEGRIGTPVYLPYELQFSDVAPIVHQYYKKPSRKLVDHIVGIINEFGRVRQLCERLHLATKIASEEQEHLSEEHFFLAIKVREQLSKHAERGEKIKKKGPRK